MYLAGSHLCHSLWKQVKGFKKLLFHSQLDTSGSFIYQIDITKTFLLAFRIANVKGLIKNVEDFCARIFCIGNHRFSNFNTLFKNKWRIIGYNMDAEPGIVCLINLFSLVQNLTLKVTLKIRNSKLLFRILIFLKHGIPCIFDE